MKTISIQDLGVASFPDAYARQRRSIEELQNGGGEEVMFLLEHPHVVTKGRNASDSALKASREHLARKNVVLVETDRGGDITYHGPGQLVGYPIIELEPGRRDIRRYVNDIEEVILRALTEFSIRARRDRVNRGVWVDDRKIASVGVRISRWVTSHGFALNVNTDLSFFSLIVPCGIPNCEMTSMSRELGRSLNMDDVKDVVVRNFCDVFDREPITVTAAKEAGSG
ncbi:MAG: lipoyl(octanoyl) transferase LipB [Candidatus Latescibacterota bacterium]|nr:MAG: lipoyl(octanoyl) transferase LipB [Candidatus Latescibacterota bacterium]